ATAFGLRQKVIAAARRTLRAPVERDEPVGLARSLDMFTDIKIARLNAFGLSRTLMIATMVIGIGNQFAVITADEFDGDVAVLNEYDPFG
ncbi:MAG: hypothetical protein KKB67_08395, partial [Alphaproteobacteria bacterium]|nr:hypothetical protein [Alphaproteobacteria bacterium]